MEAPPEWAARRGADPLTHPRRRQLMDYIRRQPGATFRELVRETGMAAGTARHHLTMLRRGGLVVERRHRSTLRFFEKGGDGDWETRVLLREAAMQRLHDWLEGHPGSIQKDILDEATVNWGWSRSTTQHRLRRLAEAGLVETYEAGRRKHYRIAPAQEPSPWLQRMQRHAEAAGWA